eukprot:TRINITY_DN6177_c0_g1_i7.p1 TRINITY_DN6177_c0_g1~~TRINITY_DN6177_c0_g1_i7.p1  ORF type:complete len:111 (+),score=10.33 TRINITY_DN6177_c0_g1_i7:101-433(+)
MATVADTEAPSLEGRAFTDQDASNSSSATSKRSRPDTSHGVALCAFAMFAVLVFLGLIVFAEHQKGTTGPKLRGNEHTPAEEQVGGLLSCGVPKNLALLLVTGLLCFPFH